MACLRILHHGADLVAKLVARQPHSHTQTDTDERKPGAHQKTASYTISLAIIGQSPLKFVSNKGFAGTNDLAAGLLRGTNSGMVPFFEGTLAVQD